MWGRSLQNSVFGARLRPASELDSVMEFGFKCLHALRPAEVKKDFVEHTSVIILPYGTLSSGT